MSSDPFRVTYPSIEEPQNPPLYLHRLPTFRWDPELPWGYAAIHLSLHTVARREEGYEICLLFVPIEMWFISYVLVLSRARCCWCKSEIAALRLGDEQWYVIISIELLNKNQLQDINVKGRYVRARYNGYMFNMFNGADAYRVVGFVPLNLLQYLKTDVPQR